MHPLVRDLYKRFVQVSKIYPAGPEVVMKKVKDGFRELKPGQCDELDIKKAVAKGRYWVRELTAISKLHKYREMNKRYGDHKPY